jgi:hypothetical protein
VGPVSDLDQPMEVEVASATADVPAATTSTANPTKKKKKTSYKNMLADMMKQSPDRDIEKEKEALRKVTGGGVFSKIDKI